MKLIYFKVFINKGPNFDKLDDEISDCLSIFYNSSRNAVKDHVVQLILKHVTKNQKVIQLYTGLLQIKL